VLNLLVRLLRLVAEPPALTHLGDPAGDRVPVADPDQPAATLCDKERRLYHTVRRRADPLGEWHSATWRMMLIKVDGQVVQSARRLPVIIPAQWPHRRWFHHVCLRIGDYAHAPRPSPDRPTTRVWQWG
jgi:hypothetical protein